MNAVTSALSCSTMPTRPLRFVLERLLSGVHAASTLSAVCVHAEAAASSGCAMRCVADVSTASKSAAVTSLVLPSQLSASLTGAAS